MNKELIVLVPIIGEKAQAVHILEELTERFNANPDPKELDLTMDVKHEYHHWLLRFPAQCVCVTEGILWERTVHRALDKAEVEKDDIKAIK